MTWWNPKTWFAKKEPVPVVEPEPEVEPSQPKRKPPRPLTGTFIEEVALAQWAYHLEHKHFLPIRDTPAAQAGAWKVLGVEPDEDMLTWVSTYSNEHGEGFEVWQRNALNKTRMLHFGPDPTRTHQPAWRD